MNLYIQNSDLIAIITSDLNDTSASYPRKNGSLCKGVEITPPCMKQSVNDHALVSQKKSNISGFHRWVNVVHKLPISLVYLKYSTNYLRSTNNTFTINMLQDEASSKYFFFTALRYNTSVNPLLLAIIIAFKIYSIGNAFWFYLTTREKVEIFRSYNATKTSLLFIIAPSWSYFHCLGR